MLDEGMTQAIFSFGLGTGLAPPSRERIGSKGHHLALMCELGLPVPPGFIIATDVCHRYLAGQKLPADVREQILSAMLDLEDRTGKRFQSEEDPLLVSVRSGSVTSMPGMLETILNIGLNDRAVEGLATASGNPRFAWNSYRRLIASYGSIVHRIPRTRFEKVFAEEKARSAAVFDRELDCEAYQRIAARCLEVFAAEARRPFPQNPQEQLIEAVEAVFRSWLAPRAMEYRRHGGIPETHGTAVTVQAMVFGNYGHGSGTGVAFTRDPSRGHSGTYVDFLLNAQGEDLVGGGADSDGSEDLLRSFPAAHRQLLELGRLLENHFADMQDIEFTLEQGKLYLLQTRTGKRTPLAAVRIAVDLAEEGIIDRATALDRISKVDLERVGQPRLVIPDGIQPMAQGEVASIGSLSGRVALTSEKANRLKRSGQPVILLRPETRTEDLPGIIAADGVITARGGRTSHAAVVARHLGKACITGCSPLDIDEREETARLGSHQLLEGDWISMDGESGRVYSGRFEQVAQQIDPCVETARAWARELGMLDHPALQLVE